MSVNANTLILETASELIDTLPENSNIRERLISVVESGDLEDIYYLNQAIIGAMAKDIMLEDLKKIEIDRAIKELLELNEDWGDPEGDFSGASFDEWGGR